MADQILLKLNSIVKDLSGTQALDGVNLTVKRGEVHAVIGKSGAGKSTLMNIIAGIFPPTEGTSAFCGEPVEFASPADS